MKKIFSKSKIISFFVCLLGCVVVWEQRWICDDAFISFRYARNFSNGHGLVYNIGEYVEGYTNFLWTILVSIGLFFDYSPIQFSYFLGIFFFLGSCYYLVKYSDFLQSAYPLAVCGFALHHHVQVFSTSGLETSMYTFLLLSGTYYCYTSDELKRITWGLILLFFASITRPDGIVFLVFSYAYYCLTFYRQILTSSDKKNFLKNSVYISIPILFYIIYLLWRYLYYGDFLPNTFYAKSAYSSYWQQGLIYFELYFLSYYIFILIPTIGVYYFVKYFPKTDLKKFLFIFLFPIVIYIFYYTKVGGDFMFARFFIPITPFLFLSLEYFNNRLIKNLYLQWIFFAIVLFSTAFYYNPYKGLKVPMINGIADENLIYKRDLVNGLSKRLKTWKDTFQKYNIRIAIGGSQAIFAYFLEAPYVLEAVTGLTDKSIANQELTYRKRIGHEKLATLEYMRSKKIHLLMMDLGLPNKKVYNTFSYKNLPGHGRIIIYDVKIMQALEKLDEFQFIRFQEYLDNYIHDIEKYDVKNVKADYLEFQKFYFQHNQDDERKSKILNIINRKEEN